MPRIVQVAVSNAAFHFDKLYSYAVPPALQDCVWPGSMVLVPFGKGSRPRMGVVLACTQQTDGHPLKELLDAAPEDARLTEDLLRLVHFLKEHTFCTYYEAVRAVIPYGAQYRPAGSQLRKQLARHTEPQFVAVAYPGEPPILTKKQTAAMTLLRTAPCTQKELAAQGLGRAVLDALCQKGLVEKRKVDKTIDLYAHIPYTGELPELTEEQQAAYHQLAGHIGSGKAHAALLFGVTSSGKTLVFLHLIRQALAQGKTALVLVPEISLTPQMITRLKAAFGSRVAVQHSALNNTERLLQWRMIQTGGADIVVGTRSAVFAPLQNLGLIILDEEQEHTYRSESAPRYHAHDVARMRAADAGALLLFASATPSTESFYAAKTGRYELVQLRQRYAGRPLPSVELVDMRAELLAGNPSEISQPLAQALAQRLAAGEQSILLLNRRGYNTVAVCAECGHVLKCGSCSVPMVYHKAQDKLLCHYCGHTVHPAPRTCPQCGGPLRYTGFGTQRAEEELARLLPTARVLRMDQDSTARKNAHETMLAQFARRDYDILLGTQMVAKGLDFEKVTLVGVLGIDSLLFSQGFRAYENVFSLITQVVGRGGRAEQPGHAIIQTVNPSHPVLGLAATQDYEAFFEQEIGFRKLCLYPPFCALCVVGFSGKREADTQRAAARFAQLLAQTARQRPQLPLRVLGPAPMNVVMIQDKYRYKLTLKCRNDPAFRQLMCDVMDLYTQEKLPEKAMVTLDMNSDGD